MDKNRDPKDVEQEILKIAFDLVVLDERRQALKRRFDALREYYVGLQGAEQPEDQEDQ